MDWHVFILRYVALSNVLCCALQHNSIDTQGTGQIAQCNSTSALSRFDSKKNIIKIMQLAQSCSPQRESLLPNISTFFVTLACTHCRIHPGHCHRLVPLHCQAVKEKDYRS